MPYQFDSDVNLRIDVAFGVNPLTIPTSTQWTEIGDYVTDIGIARGRTHELDEIASGTLTLQLDNRDRRFDPTNTGSPYSPNVKPMVPIRVQAVHSGTTYALYSGFAEAWPQMWTEAGLIQETQVRAVDGFKLLSYVETGTTHAQEKSGARVDDYLDEAGWSASARAVSTGKATLAAYVGVCTTILEELQRITVTENGLFFMDGAGLPTFQSSTVRSGGVPGSTFTDTGGLAYTGLQVGYDDVNVWNDITVQALNVAPQAIDDTGSVDSYGRRKLHIFDTLQPNATGAADLASALLAKYKDPVVKVESMTVEARGSTGAWPTVLGAEISDLVRVKRVGQSGSAISEDLYIEGISHEITAEKTWVTTMVFTPTT